MRSKCVTYHRFTCPTCLRKGVASACTLHQCLPLVLMVDCGDICKRMYQCTAQEEIQVFRRHCPAVFTTRGVPQGHHNAANLTRSFAFRSGLFRCALTRCHRGAGSRAEHNACRGVSAWTGAERIRCGRLCSELKQIWRYWSELVNVRFNFDFSSFSVPYGSGRPYP